MLRILPAKRERGTLCPLVGVHAAAASALLGALYRRGWAAENGGVPIITPAGRSVVDKAAAAT